MKKTNILAIVVVLSVTLMTFTVMAKSEGSSGNGKSVSQEKKDKSSESKSDAKLYRESSKEATKEMKESAKELKESSKTEKNMEQEKVAKEIEQIVQEQEQTTEEVAGAIEEVEQRNKFKTLLIGTDYKNLGQLRSSLVQNRNQIRKITKLIEKNQDPAAGESLQVQLTALMQEREIVKSVIQTNEEGFSVLGWVRKLFNGYEETPLENEEEEQLNEEVAEALEKTVTDDGASTETIPVTNIETEGVGSED